MSKGCDEAAGNTSGHNPDPESPLRRRRQASRKGGRERGSGNEETRSLTWRESRDRCAECQGRSRGGSLTGSRCIQHETDHLDGILFIDRMDPAQRKLAMKAIREAEWWGDPIPKVRLSPHETLGRAL